MLMDEHDGNSGNFSYPPFEVLVAGGNDVAFVLGHSLLITYRYAHRIAFIYMK